MASLPSKGVTGDNFKKWAVDSINKLIEYLGGPFIRGGKGIAVRQAGNVTIIELEKQPSVPAQKSGVGTTQDISATVSGGTAFIGLSGSTATAELVGTGDVEIRGNTNGQIEFDVQGGTGGLTGFPNYQNAIVDRGDVDLSGTTYFYNYPVWLIGNVGASSDENDQVRFNLNLWLGSSHQERVGISTTSNDYTFMGTITTFVCIPIQANTPFYFTTTDDLNLYRNELAIYPSL